MAVLVKFLSFLAYVFISYFMWWTNMSNILWRPPLSMSTIMSVYWKSFVTIIAIEIIKERDEIKW